MGTASINGKCVRLGLGVALAALGLATGRVADAQPASDPPAERLIAPIPDDVDVPVAGWRECGMARWVEWPSAEYIAERQPPRDRRAQYPAVYPHGDRRLPPLERGASSIRRVRLGCVQWLRALIKPEFIPDDPEAALILLQEPDPKQSSVFCRLRSDDTVVQVRQSDWAVCVVVRPAPELIGGLAPKEVGRAAFRGVLTRGDKMANDALAEVGGLPPGLSAFQTGVPADLEYVWSNFYFWYTDGHAVAVFFWRCDGGPHVPRPGQPWF